MDGSEKADDEAAWSPAKSWDSFREMEARLPRAQTALTNSQPRKGGCSGWSYMYLRTWCLMVYIGVKVVHLRGQQRPNQTGTPTERQSKMAGLGLSTFDNSLSNHPTINNCSSSLRGENAEKRCCSESLCFTLSKSKCNLRWQFFLCHYKIRAFCQ